ncbi:MAG: hypothetical protein H6807_16170 [Planctomycetes bacterium]|nr:hypothetical protein [Planctomycetota bacterium]
MLDRSRTSHPRKRSGSRLDWVRIPRSVLGVERSFGVYLPDGYGRETRGYPVLYLFRGHEEEWAGRQDGRPGLKSTLDRMIGAGTIQPLVVVLPGFMPPSRRHQGVPLDWCGDAAAEGAGNGRFERHFFEVKSLVEERFAVRVGRRHSALDGFSMGGFSSVYLGVKYPHLFGSVGAYDGSFMWPRQIDPRRAPRGRACRLWFGESTAPIFRDGCGWHLELMERANPMSWLKLRGGRRGRELRSMRFHVRAAGTEAVGNLDRNLALDEALLAAGCFNSFRDDPVLSGEARHDWKWADRHLEGTLVLHDRVFRLGLSS